MIAREYVKLYLAHVALCCRIRQDKTGRAEGVDAQEKWGREYATQTWPGVSVVVYGDNDIPAANRDPGPDTTGAGRPLGTARWRTCMTLNLKGTTMRCWQPPRR